MKLRKAIKLVVASAVIGAVPMLAQAANPLATATATVDTDGTLIFTCATEANLTCDTANAIDAVGFYSVTVTDTDDGSTYYQTFLAEDGGAGVGTFAAESVVGHESNGSGFAAGIFSTTRVEDTTDNGFTSGAQITTGDYAGMKNLVGDTSVMEGMQMVLLDQNLTGLEFSSDFNFDHGMIMTGMGGGKYAILNIADTTNDSQAMGGGTFNATFNLDEFAKEGGSANGMIDALIGKSIRASSTIDDSPEFTQNFNFESSEGSFSADGGGLGVSAGTDADIAFTAGQLVSGTEITQTVEAMGEFSFATVDNLDDSTTAASDSFSVGGSVVTTTGSDPFSTL